MTNELILLGFIALQQVYFLRQIQKLVDKIMSRSYTEYLRAQEPKPKIPIKLDNEPVEDLGVLQGFGM